MLECRLHLAASNEFALNDMNQIEQLASEQLQSCQKYPIPRPGSSAHVSEFVFWLAFDASLRAEASAIPRCLADHP